MHQFDLLGEVFGRQAIEQVPKAINPVRPPVVVVDVVKKRVVVSVVSKVCSRGVYENELKIVVEPCVIVMPPKSSSFSGELTPGVV